MQSFFILQHVLRLRIIRYLPFDVFPLAWIDLVDLSVQFFLLADINAPIHHCGINRILLLILLLLQHPISKLLEVELLVNDDGPLLLFQLVEPVDLLVSLHEASDHLGQSLIFHYQTPISYFGFAHRAKLHLLRCFPAFVSGETWLAESVKTHFDQDGLFHNICADLTLELIF